MQPIILRPACRGLHRPMLAKDFTIRTKEDLLRHRISELEERYAAILARPICEWGPEAWQVHEALEYLRDLRTEH